MMETARDPRQRFRGFDQFIYDLIREISSEGFFQQIVPAVQLLIQILDLFHGPERILKLHQVAEISEHADDLFLFPVFQIGGQKAEMPHFSVSVIRNDPFMRRRSFIDRIQKGLHKLIVFRLI